MSLLERRGVHHHSNFGMNVVDSTCAQAVRRRLGHSMASQVSDERCSSQAILTVRRQASDRPTPPQHRSEAMWTVLPRHLLDKLGCQKILCCPLEHGLLHGTCRASSTVCRDVPRLVWRSTCHGMGKLHRRQKQRVCGGPKSRATCLLRGHSMQKLRDRHAFFCLQGDTSQNHQRRARAGSALR